MAQFLPSSLLPRNNQDEDPVSSKYNQTLDESSKSVTDLINQLGKLQIQQLGTSKVLKEDQVKSLQNIDELFNELDKVEEKRRETSKMPARIEPRLFVSVVECSSF